MKILSKNPIFKKNRSEKEAENLNSQKFFIYKNLNEILYKLYQKNIHSITINLLISLEKEFYEGQNFKLILQDLQKLTEKRVINLNYKDIKTDFEVSKIQIEVGDILNRHVWYYRYCEEYMLDNGLNQEENIPEKIRKEFIKKSYESGKKQGEDWFKRNIDAINVLIPYKKLTADFQLNNEITSLYEGDNDNAELEFVCYEYWLNHLRYKTVEKALTEVRNLPNSIIERAYNHEANYFYERKSKKQNIEFKGLFTKQSKAYLVDETIPVVIKHSDANNAIEFYFGNESDHTQVYKGKKINRDKNIIKYLNTSLKGVQKRNFVQIALPNLVIK
jgi:hypothetical protein